MNKQKKQLMVMGGLLLLCVAMFVAVKMLNANQAQKDEEAARQESEALTIHTMAKESICKISYLYEGEQITLIKDDDDVWRLDNDREKTLKTMFLDNMTLRLSSLEARTIIENVTNLAEYGLDEGYNVVSCETKDGESFTYYIGDKNGITGNFYIMLPEDPATVYAVSNLFANPFATPTSDLIVTEEEEEE